MGLIWVIIAMKKMLDTTMGIVQLLTSGMTTYIETSWAEHQMILPTISSKGFQSAPASLRRVP